MRRRVWIVAACVLLGGGGCGDDAEPVDRTQDPDNPRPGGWWSACEADAECQALGHYGGGNGRCAVQGGARLLFDGEPRRCVVSCEFGVALGAPCEDGRLLDSVCVSPYDVGVTACVPARVDQGLLGVWEKGDR